MENRDLIYKMAFSFLGKNISADFLRNIEEKGISPEAFFKLPTKDLIAKLGIKNDHRFDTMAREKAMNLAHKEKEHIERHNISALFVLDDDYPSQVAETYDAPVILYKLGEADLEADYMISVVGTRKPTPYGVECCNTLIGQIGDYFPEATIISGLAYGIDAAAHKKALEKNLPTVAVVAHGLNMIYPAANRNLAKEIIRQGGAIISEYPFGTTPYRANFLARNRIVAALSDVTVVVESNIKGGAMSTANLAFSYNRDVMAFPGRTSDTLSSGCNLLIRKQKAHLLESAADLIEVTGWQPLGVKLTSGQRNLFPEIEGDHKIVYELLRNSSDPLQFDTIVHATKLAPSRLLAILGELEFDGIIMRYPGNRFSIS